MDFGIFVCSTCSGFHREMTHKVKGVGMSNFSDKELEFLKKNGNEVILLIQPYCRMFIKISWEITILKYIQNQIKKIFLR